MAMAAKTAKENMGSSNHMENLDDVKVEAGENYVAEQREQMRLLNARIVRKVNRPPVGNSLPAHISH